MILYHQTTIVNDQCNAHVLYHPKELQFPQYGVIKWPLKHQFPYSTEIQ